MQANIAISHSNSNSIASAKDRRHIKNLIMRRENSIEPASYNKPNRYLYNTDAVRNTGLQNSMKTVPNKSASVSAGNNN
jgi:hypothetical protein